MNDFNGIWLAAPILELPDLNLTEKVILSQVITLSRESECRAQNEYIAGKTGLTKTSISLILGKLQEKGYLVIDAGQTAGNKRQMWPSLKSLHTLFKNLKEGEQSSLKIFKTLYKNFKEVVKNLNEGHSNTERPYLKILHTLFKNLKELIYRIDNKIDNKEDNKPSKEYKAVPARADAPFWSVLIKPVDFYRNRKAYKAFVRAEVKKNAPRSEAPPLADDQFAYEYAAGKTEILQWPDSFSPAMREHYLTKWLPYHRKQSGKRLTVDGVMLQLGKLTGLSQDHFFDVLNKAVESNWQSFHVKPINHAVNPTSQISGRQGQQKQSSALYEFDLERELAKRATGHVDSRSVSEGSFEFVD